MYKLIDNSLLYSLPLLIVFLVTCVIMVIGIWLILRSKMKFDPANSESNSREEDYVGGRRSMHYGDWFNAVLLVISGLFLGIAIDGLVQLFTTAYWPVGVIMLLLLVGLFLFEKLFDRIFPSGINPARKPQVAERMPFPRLLSFPSGLIIGFTLAKLGFGDTIIRLIW